MAVSPLDFRPSTNNLTQVLNLVMSCPIVGRCLSKSVNFVCIYDEVTDIGNAYLNAPNKVKVHVTFGPELFGEDHAGKTAVIIIALYGLKSADNAWRHYFASFIRDTLAYTPTNADPDVYRKVQSKADGTQYYSYLIIYVDDVLCIHETPDVIMDKIGATFRLKNGYETPLSYLGADLRQ